MSALDVFGMFILSACLSILIGWAITEAIDWIERNLDE